MTILLSFALIPLSALAVAASSGWRLCFWSLAFSFLLLVFGAVPFYIAEVTAPAEGGAPFIFLGWIAEGPFVTFVLMPLMFAFATWRSLTGKRRRYGLPLAVSILISAILFASVLSSSGEFIPSMVLMVIPIGLVILVVWLLYLTAMDWARNDILRNG